MNVPRTNITISEPQFYWLYHDDETEFYKLNALKIVKEIEEYRTFDWKVFNNKPTDEQQVELGLMNALLVDRKGVKEDYLNVHRQMILTGDYRNLNEVLNTIELLDLLIEIIDNVFTKIKFNMKNKSKRRLINVNKIIQEKVLIERINI